MSADGTIPSSTGTSFRETRITDSDFVALAHELDLGLTQRYDIPLSQLQNKLDPQIPTALILYKGGQPVACGCILPVELPASCLADLESQRVSSDELLAYTMGKEELDKQLLVTEMRRIFVRAKHRGSNNGSLAVKLVQALEALALKLGSAAMILKTGGAQPEAMRMYHKFGYRPISLYGQPFNKGPTNSLGKVLQ